MEKLGLCLSGGGTKAFAHIGALKALEESNVKFSYIAGTSSGSIVATLYAIGYSADEIYDIFKKNSKKIKYIDFKILLKLFFGLLIKRKVIIDGLNDGNMIYKLMNRYCKLKGIKNISEIKMPLLIPTVNIYDEDLYIFYSQDIENINLPNNIKYINNADISSIVQASCSFPGFFSPCKKIENLLLIDGGIEENIPWREEKRVGADKVLSIIFKNEMVNNNTYKDIVEILKKSFNILCHELERYEVSGTDYLLEIKQNSIGLLNYKESKKLYKAGYIQTRKFINENPSLINKSYDV